MQSSPSSFRLSPGRKLSRPNSRSVLYGENSTPRYAQPTVSFSQHAKYQLNEPTNIILKAGKSRSANSTLRAHSNVFKGSLTEMFNFENHLNSSYKENSQPTLMKQPDLLVDKLKSTENLLKTLEPSKEATLSYEELMFKVADKSHVSKQDWKELVDYHFKVVNEAYEKLRNDFKLIENVLELNNHISKTLKDKELELNEANNEIQKLNLSLLNYQHPVRKISKFEELGSANSNSNSIDTNDNSSIVDMIF